MDRTLANPNSRVSSSSQVQLNQSEIFEQNKPLIRERNDDARKSDPIWETVFKGVMIVTIVLSIFMICLGDPSKMSHPADPDGNFCGLNETAEFPLIYFVTPSKEFMYRAVCVRTCPLLTSQPQQNAQLDCKPNSVVPKCNLHISPNERNDEVMIYDSHSYLNKVCMPRNVQYFQLVSDALRINQLQLAISDMRAKAGIIFFFALLAFAFSYATKFLIDNEKKLQTMINVFFYISTIGFFILWVSFAYRFYVLSSAPTPDNKKVVDDVEVFQQTMNSSNASPFGNLLLALFCLASCCAYMYNALSPEGQNEAQSLELRKVRNRMLLYVSDVIKQQGLEILPIYSIIPCMLIIIFFFIVETNAYAVGSVSTEKTVLPFDRFNASFLVRTLNFILTIGYFWALIFIIQVADFISLKQSIRAIERREKSNPKNSSNNTSTIQDDIKEVYDYRMGTIAKCAILTFFAYYPRAILEAIDTSYQQKVNQALLNVKIVNREEVVHTPIMKAQRWISNLYKTTMLKSIQPYGFIFTFTEQMDFIEAGALMQDKIDQTSSWLEDILDRGELFEQQIKFTICFSISLLFFFVSLLITDEISKIVSPSLLMVVLSFIIASIFVNTYGSIFSSFVLYYLIKEFNHKKQDVNNNDGQIKNFNKFMNTITKSQSSEITQKDPENQETGTKFSL